MPLKRYVNRGLQFREVSVDLRTQLRSFIGCQGWGGGGEGGPGNLPQQRVPVQPCLPSCASLIFLRNWILGAKMWSLWPTSLIQTRLHFIYFRLCRRSSNELLSSMKLIHPGFLSWLIIHVRVNKHGSREHWGQGWRDGLHKISLALALWQLLGIKLWNFWRIFGVGCSQNAPWDSNWVKLGRQAVGNAGILLRSC